MLTEKPTKAQKAFLREHLNGMMPTHVRRDLPDGYRPRLLTDRGSKTWNFVARVRDAGFVEIENDPKSYLRFPYGWAGTRITPTGRAALEAERKRT